MRTPLTNDLLLTKRSKVKLDPTPKPPLPHPPPPQPAKKESLTPSPEAAAKPAPSRRKARRPTLEAVEYEKGGEEEKMGGDVSEEEEEEQADLAPAKVEKRQRQRGQVGAGRGKVEAAAPPSATASSTAQSRLSGAKPSTLQLLSSPSSSAVQREYDKRTVVRDEIDLIESAQHPERAPFHLREKVQVKWQDERWWDAIIIGVDLTHDILELTRHELTPRQIQEDDEPPMVGLTFLHRDYNPDTRRPLTSEDEWCYRILWRQDDRVDPAYYVGRVIRRKGDRASSLQPSPTQPAGAKERSRLTILASAGSGSGSRPAHAASKSSSRSSSPARAQSAAEVPAKPIAVENLAKGVAEHGEGKPVKEERQLQPSVKKEVATDDGLVDEDGAPRDESDTQPLSALLDSSTQLPAAPVEGAHMKVDEPQAAWQEGAIAQAVAHAPSQHEPIVSSTADVSAPPSALVVEGKQMPAAAAAESRGERVGQIKTELAPALSAVPAPPAPVDPSSPSVLQGEKSTADPSPPQSSPSPAPPAPLETPPPPAVEEEKMTPAPKEVKTSTKAEAAEGKVEATLPPRPTRSPPPPFRAPSSSLSSLSSPVPYESSTPPKGKRKPPMSEWNALRGSTGGAGAVVDESEAVARALAGGTRPRRGSLEGKDIEGEDVAAPTRKRLRQRRTSGDSSASSSPSPASSPALRAAAAPPAAPGGRLPPLSPLAEEAAPAEEAKHTPMDTDDTPALPKLDESKADSSESKPPPPPIALPVSAANAAAPSQPGTPPSASGGSSAASGALAGRKRVRLSEVERLQKTSPGLLVEEAAAMTRRASGEQQGRPPVARTGSLEHKQQTEEEVEVDIMGKGKRKGDSRRG